MLWPSDKTAGPGWPDPAERAAMSPPATAAATNKIPVNNRPLPRNTVANKRSSRAPIRSRTTPMNHRNAMPANGTRLSATATPVRWAEWLSQVPGWPASAGSDTSSSTITVASSTAKMIPAAPAARGVRRALLTPAPSCGPVLVVICPR